MYFVSYLCRMQRLMLVRFDDYQEENFLIGMMRKWLDLLMRINLSDFCQYHSLASPFFGNSFILAVIKMHVS